MDLAQHLGYRYLPQGPLRRGVTRLAATRPVSRLLARVQRPADRVVWRLSRGATTATALLVGMPVLWVTTTGAKSGKSRTVPLLAIPYGHGLALMGTHYGTRHTPGWVYNLMANPSATAACGGKQVEVEARRLDEGEAAPVWDAAASIYSGYSRYRERASHRKIEVFLLEPA